MSELSDIILFEPNDLPENLDLVALFESLASVVLRHHPLLVNYISDRETEGLHLFKHFNDVLLLLCNYGLK